MWIRGDRFAADSEKLGRGQPSFPRRMVERRAWCGVAAVCRVQKKVPISWPSTRKLHLAPGPALPPPLGPGRPPQSPPLSPLLFPSRDPV